MPYDPNMAWDTAGLKSNPPLTLTLTLTLTQKESGFGLGQMTLFAKKGHNITCRKTGVSTRDMENPGPVQGDHIYGKGDLQLLQFSIDGMMPHLEPKLCKIIILLAS